MIGRYTLPEMGRVWSEQHKYELWCRVETLVLEAHAAAGRVPADVVEPVRNAPPPTPGRVAEIEETTQHDVIAFLTAWADNTTPRSAAAYVHHGMTSSDLLDTALAVQLTDATDVLLAKADRLVAALRDHGLAHRNTIKVGRTHGVHAEPDGWGHRVAEIEETTQHDVIAFLSSWADNTEPRSASAYVHHGMTSSDLLDTAL
ncbi:MAG: purB, partial [Modestobacter sp.]|nr:purB [Modestobacter sp.]